MPRRKTRVKEPLKNSAYEAERGNGLRGTGKNRGYFCGTLLILAYPFKFFLKKGAKPPVMLPAVFAQQ